MPVKRGTIRDRNAAALAATPTPPQPLGASAPGADGPRAPAPAARVSRQADLAERAVLSITIRPEDLDQAKSAYLFDWLREGRHDTFPRWLGAVIRRHAALASEERAQIEATRPPKVTSRGLKRAFQMDPRDVAEMARARNDDFVGHRRYVSEADWCGDAIRQAIEAARTAAGGTLPPPPARLPNRMPPR